MRTQIDGNGLVVVCGNNGSGWALISDEQNVTPNLTFKILSSVQNSINLFSG